MHPTTGFYLTFLCSLFSLSLAVRLPFYTRFNKSLPSRFVRRANISTGAVPITNTHNAEYIANITLGGQQVPVLLDTGSSDLWVTGSIPQTQDTGKSASLSYAVGQANGNINLASLSFDNYSVSNQAYLLVTDTSTFSTDITAQGYNGLVGLGPNTGSVILKKLDQGAAGDTMLNRIFQQNMTTRNFISFLLSRTGDPGDPITGQLTISEVVPGYESISNYPQLSVQKVQGGSLTDADQHWQVLTDKNIGIIGPDGQPIQASSYVSHAPSGTLVAVIDSGFTFSQVPREVSDAIYGRVQGAIYDTTDEIWTLPCDQILNISFNIGGSNFPIHPLDTVSSDFNTTGPQGQPLCLGAFQPITSAFSLLGEYDIILGMAFLRNAYTLLDYGDFVENTSNDQVKPYVQIMPITNSASAHQDFVKVRLNGVDNSNDPSKALLPPSQEQHSPESAHEKKLHYEARVLSHWPEILVGCLLFVIFIVGFVVWRCCCRRGKRRSKKTDSFIPMADNEPYAHLSGSHLGHGYSSTTHLAGYSSTHHLAI